VIFYGLVSLETNSVIEFFSSRERAETERLNVIADEPDWEPILSVVAIDFSGEQAGVLRGWRAP
jgi:hypothetical protein